MNIGSQSATTPVPRLWSFMLGLLPFCGFFVFLPLWWVAAAFPVSLTPAAKWLYVLNALGISALVAAFGARPERRLGTFAVVGLLMLVPVVLVAAGISALDSVFDFTTVERVQQVPSPSGALVLVHDYVDMGATGEQHVVYVCGRLMPGLVDWRYPVESDTFPETMEWTDSRTVLVNGQAYRLPALMEWSSW